MRNSTGHRTYLCVLEVVAPQRADLVLASHIPHREADVLVLHRLHVEACSKVPKQVSIPAVARGNHLTMHLTK